MFPPSPLRSDANMANENQPTLFGKPVVFDTSLDPGRTEWICQPISPEQYTEDLAKAAEAVEQKAADALVDPS